MEEWAYSWEWSMGEVLHVHSDIPSCDEVAIAPVYPICDGSLSVCVCGTEKPRDVRDMPMRAGYRDGFGTCLVAAVLRLSA